MNRLLVERRPLAAELVAGQFDLSVGSSAGLAGIVLASVAAHHSLLLGVLAAIGVGLGAGAINGYFVTVVGINPLITTLGMLSALRDCFECDRADLGIVVRQQRGDHQQHRR